MVTGVGASAMRLVFQRAFVHGHMKKTAKSFASGTLSNTWKNLLGMGRVPTDLQLVASAFANLQEARHEADYDLNRHFSRSEVDDLIEVAEKATEAWRRNRKTPEARVFLTALLVYDRVS